MKIINKSSKVGIKLENTAEYQIKPGLENNNNDLYFIFHY